LHKTVGKKGKGRKRVAKQDLAVEKLLLAFRRVTGRK